MNIKNIIIILFLTGFIIGSMLIYLPKIYVISTSLIMEGINTETPIIPNIPFTGTSITGTTTNPSYSGITSETLIDNIRKEYIATKYNLPTQPVSIPNNYSYSDRSQVIIDYMTKNTLKISPNKFSNGYIYIKLYKTPRYPIFIYWHGSSTGYDKKSGDLDLSRAKQKISDTEYLFDISAIPYTRYYDNQPDIYNWKSDINKSQSLYVALASKGFDGNGVAQLIIYRK